MSDALETMGFGQVDDEEAVDDAATDDGALTSHVSAASFRVAQAAEGLRQAEGLLRAAEELTTDAERRRVDAEQRLAETERRNADLEEMLAMAETRRGGSPERGLTVIVDDERDELKEAVASEIRRPLTSLLGVTLALKHADMGSTDGKAMVRQLTMNAHRLERLVDQLLELDQLVSGSLEPKRRRTDLGALVRRVIEETPDIANRDVELDAERVAVSIDPSLVEQIVEALLTNAGCRTAPGEAVWVSVRSGHGGAMIAVDDGSGEPASGLPYRGSTDAPARSKQPTSLALVLRLAELHLGSAWIEERPEGGASFRVFLPDGVPEGAAEAADDPDAEPTDEPGTTDDLIVDTSTGSTSDVIARLRALSYDDLSNEVSI